MSTIVVLKNVLRKLFKAAPDRAERSEAQT
jgi:hypothetical protein